MRKILNVVSALSTGITLLTLLTVASLVGVIIPQGLEPESYLEKLGTVAGSMLLSIDADHLFSSLWYNILLGLFSVNIVACTLGRVGVSFKKLSQPAFLSGNHIAALHLNENFTCQEVAPEQLEPEITALFKKRGCSVKKRPMPDGMQLTAERGSLREFGSLILHLCIIPLIIGGMVAKFYGFSYVQNLAEGESAVVQDHTFAVRCDFFTIEKTASGAIKDYKSGLTILDSTGSTLAKKVIEVNHPLVYSGIKFYQSSFANVPGGYDSIKLVVTGPKIGPIGKSITVKPMSAITLPGSEITVTAGAFYPDFFLDMETKTAQNRSPHPENPAIMVSVMSSADTLFDGWVFEKFGAMHHDDDAYQVSFVAYTTKQSTGLLIKKNPGSPLIWFGIFGMSIGVLLVFWVPRRRYRAAFCLSSNTTTLFIGTMQPASDADALAEWKSVKSALTAIVSKHTAPEASTLPLQQG